MTTSVSHGDDDHAKLGESRFRTVGRKELGNGLGLWPRIDILYDGVRLRRVEIKRFVHHTIQVRNSISCFDFKRFRKLISGFE